MKPQLREVARDRQEIRFVVVVHAHERGAMLGQPLTDRELRLCERHAEARRSAHHLAGGLHFRPEDRVHAREPHEREHRALDEDAGHLEILRQPEIGERTAGHDFGRDLRERHTRGLREVRHRARRARIHLEHVHHIVFRGELNVHQTDDVQRAGDSARVIADRRQMALGADERRHHARAVAGMNARLFDVLHDAADDDRSCGVRDGIHVELEGVLEELVDEDRMLG